MVFACPVPLCTFMSQFFLWKKKKTKQKRNVCDLFVIFQDTILYGDFFCGPKTKVHSSTGPRMQNYHLGGVVYMLNMFIQIWSGTEMISTNEVVSLTTTASGIQGFIYPKCNYFITTACPTQNTFRTWVAGSLSTLIHVKTSNNLEFSFISKIISCFLKGMQKLSLLFFDACVSLGMHRQCS